MEQNRALRVGCAAVLCALTLRLFSSGVPARLRNALLKPDTLAFLTYLETGRDVRFSPYLEGFSPDFMESPPAATTEPTQPVFSPEEIARVTCASAKEPNLEALLATPLQWDLTEDVPAVLILHTHATESYTKTGEDYPETADYRTAEEEYNMLSLGAYVARQLESAGIGVLHDTTLHDYPSYNGSYTRARKSIRSYLEEYPSIRLVLDLHRDAVEVSYGQLRTHARTEQGDCAQLMIVLGTNYETWQDNLALGLKLHAQLERQVPGITRPLQLRASRFNQDLSPGALLIEIGAAGNTHAEAMAAAEQLSLAIAALSRGTAQDDSP